MADVEEAGKSPAMDVGGVKRPPVPLVELRYSDLSYEVPIMVKVRPMVAERHFSSPKIDAGSNRLRRRSKGACLHALFTTECGSCRRCGNTVAVIALSPQ